MMQGLQTNKLAFSGHGPTTTNRPAPHSALITPSADSIHFGAQKADKATRVEKAQMPPLQSSKPQTFFEPGTPFFFLHGTSSTGKALSPLVDWVNTQVGEDHPVYVSYLPEVQQGTGIENDSPEHYAAYKMALRDMGDFTYQLVNLKIAELKSLVDELSGLSDPSKANQHIGEFFGVLEADRDWLSPILLDKLITPIFQRPPELASIGLPLDRLAQNGVDKVMKEVDKLALRPRHKKRKIYDTSLLHTLAEVQFPKDGLNTDIQRVSAKQVNLRPINFQDIAKMELYLTHIADNLTAAIKEALADQASQQGGVTPADEILEKRARSTTDTLMQKLAPRGMSFGHSQGGTVLMLASLMTMENAKKPKTDKLNPEAIELAGRFNGFSMLFNAPVMGINEDPAIGRVVREELEKLEERFPILKDRSTKLYEHIKQFVWNSKENDSPAVSEMRIGSPLMENIQKRLPDIQEYAEKTGFSLSSVWDKNDLYVEKQASELSHRGKGKKRGQPLPQVFNVELSAIQMHPRYRTPDDMLKSLSKTYGRMAGWISTHLTQGIKEYAYNIYTHRLIGVEQHRAFLMLPDYVSTALGKKMLDDPTGRQNSNLVRALEPNSFEPFRSQALKVRRKIMQKWTERQTPKETAMMLEKFLRDYPGYLTALVKNAEQQVPLENSASWQAALLLDDTLDALSDIVESPKLRQKHHRTLLACLRELAGADINYSTRPDEEPISQRAKRLLSEMGGPTQG